LVLGQDSSTEKMDKLLTVMCLLFLFYIQTSGSYSIRIDDNFVNNRENNTCTICPDGTYSAGFTVEGKYHNCSEYCIPGSCPSGVNCTDCSAGTYNDRDNATMCKQCPSGYVSQERAFNCSICKAGTSSNDDRDRCTPCSRGTFNPTDGLVCQSCPPGQFSNVSGQLFCRDCLRGTYNPSYRQTVCKACGVGKYNPETESKTETACLTCPAGYYCPSERTVTPEACPDDNFCPAGASSPRECPALFESGKNSDSCQPKAALYLLMLGGVAVLVVIISVIVCVKAGSTREKKRTEKEPAKESDRLIRESQEGPVYEGL